MNTPVIGIDLGTTNSCVGVVKNGKVEIIANEQGNRTNPSVVCFTPHERLIGQAAKDVSHKYPENTVYDIKKIIGSKFNDESTQEEIKKWPFKVVDYLSNPSICVMDKGHLKEFYCEQISAMVLGYVKKLAEDYLGQQITRAVITVPAYFNHSQRQATKDAAEIAGLKVVRIINEPTAAALAYGWENKSDVGRKVLVYDLGGGTFDVSILQIEGNDYQVLSTSGDTHLGGTDFDNRMVDYFVSEFETKHNKHLRSDVSALRRLRSKCESDKEKLSFFYSIDMEFASLFEDEDFYTSISRATFEELNDDLFKRTIEIVEKCVTDSKLSKEDITDIVLVGGSTRIPKIQEMLSNTFGGRPLRKSVNPDEAVAYGAAIQGAILDGEKRDSPMDINITDVISLSLGEEMASGEFCVIIPRNTPIPHKVTETFFTAYDNQLGSTVKIYQGERMVAKLNHLLGEFFVMNIPPKPAGEVKFVDTFYVDHDGILHVDSVEEESGQRGNITIGLTENRLPVEEVQRLIVEAEQKRAEDMKASELLRARYEVESYSCSVKVRLMSMVEQFDDDKCKEILEDCHSCFARAKDMVEKEEITNMLSELKLRCEPLFLNNNSEIFT